MASKYALLVLQTLNVMRFDHQEDMQLARRSLMAKGRDVVILKYHHGVDSYIVPDNM